MANSSINTSGSLEISPYYNQDISMSTDSMSPSIKNLAKAMVKANAIGSTIETNADGYGYKYTSLDYLLSKIKPELQKLGLCFIQTPCGGGGEVGLRTMLIHESGEYICSSFTCPIIDSKQNNIYQSAGTAITYLRRYSVLSFLNLMHGEDSDGALKEPEPTTLTEEQRNSLTTIREEAGVRLSKINYAKFVRELMGTKKDPKVNGDNYEKLYADMKEFLKENEKAPGGIVDIHPITHKNSNNGKLKTKKVSK